MEAIKTYTINGYEDSFDYWWNNEGVKLINPKTPTSIIAEFKRISEKAWHSGWKKSDECTEAIAINPYVAFA